MVLALISFANTFDIPFILTGGGPANSTTTLGLELYNQAFRTLRFGYGSAQASIQILIVLVLAIFIWAIMTGLNVRLRFVPEDEESPGEGVLSVISLPLIFLMSIPMVGLLLWGVWLVLSNGGFPTRAG